MFGSGDYTYDVVEEWWTPPNGWAFGVITGVACDSEDRVYVYSRSDHPMVVHDRDGTFLHAWGEGVLKDAHGLLIDADDSVFCVERQTHCMHKFSRDGDLLMTVGTPDQKGAEGEPLNLPTDIDFDSQGFMYISDGYGNRRVHKCTPDGWLVRSWGKHGTGPGQFVLPHCVRIDKRDRVLVADRPNDRIQFFDTDGTFTHEWTGLHWPDGIYIDDEDEVVYVAEHGFRVSIWTFEGEKITEWGGGEASEAPGRFKWRPHGIWVDSRGDVYVTEVEGGPRLQKFARRR
ncbi:hypothetical protein CMK11_10840 [Candidatus Poribacteria bacterium]|nr:hypothetical protein [Candidatus Poribacteria bacterium]